MSRLTSVTFTSPVFPHDRLSEFIPTLVRGYRGQGVGEPFPILGPFLQNNVSRSLVWSHSGILSPLWTALAPPPSLLTPCYQVAVGLLVEAETHPEVTNTLVSISCCWIWTKTGYKTKLFFVFFFFY